MSAIKNAMTTTEIALRTNYIEGIGISWSIYDSNCANDQGIVEYGSNNNIDEGNADAMEAFKKYLNTLSY